MNHLPNIWGQGQLFAFSYLDGDSFAGDDLCGMLSGDRIGVRFYLKVKRELAIVNLSGNSPCFEAVTGDLIRLRLADGGCIRLIFAKRNLVIGETASGAYPAVFTEGDFDLSKEGNAEIQDTKNGEFTAIARKGNRFAFAFAHTKAECVSIAEAGLSLNPDEEEEKKLAFFLKHAGRVAENDEQLFFKCLSVMKTHLYSPEAEFQTAWSTPDRLPHKHLWLWDSVFHAVGHRHFDPALAEDLIRAIRVHQSEDGFIPHMADIGLASSITQPPVIGWGAWKTYEKSKNKRFLEEVFAFNARFLRWLRENRKLGARELYTWKTSDEATCRCDECGMDNSPRFDIRKLLYAIDLTCFMANDVRWMAKIAKELGLPEEAEKYAAWFEEIRKDVNECLWSEEDGFYFDSIVGEERLHKVWSVASFLPLFASLCSEKQAEALARHLADPESFFTPMPIPSISKKDPTFGTDMWRGPVWLNYNLMISEGLEAFGFAALSEEILNRTVESMKKWYLAGGTIYEFYDSEALAAPNRLTRKGPVFEPYSIDVRMQSIRDYGWSCTILADILLRKRAK